MKLRLSAFLTFMILVTSATALSNGLALNSVGPKGLGMGGAFVGLANDYTAIFWNPAGLTQMQNNFIGAYVTDVIPMGTYKLDAAKIDAKTNVVHYAMPGITGGYHWNVAENTVFALGVYAPAGLGTEWNGVDLASFANGVDTIQWKTKIGLITIAPAIAYKFSDQFSVGAALDIYYAMFDLKKPSAAGTQYSESSHGFGATATFSILSKPTEEFSFGLSLRLKTNVKMRGTVDMPILARYGLMTSSNFDRNVGWPMWLALGFAYHPMKTLVLTADIQFTQWSVTEDKFVADYSQPKWRALLYPGANNIIVLHWNDATQLRLGADYSVTEQFDVRAGFYVDPAPAPDQTLNVLFPSISYTGISLGIGYKIDKFVIDAAGEYLFGKDREIPLASTTYYNMPGTQGMDVPAWSLGIGYEF